LNDDTDMPPKPDWPEVESQVYCAGNWIVWALSMALLMMGGIGLWVTWNGDLRGMSVWIATAITAFLALIGGLLLIKSLGAILGRRRVRHAAPDVLRDVPNEPATLEGSVVSGRLTHELIEDSAGWQLRASESLRRKDTVFLLGFGIPFLAVVAGLLSWALDGHGIEGGWPVAILVSILITLLCGGSVIFATIIVNRFQFRTLSRLIIPHADGDLELETPSRGVQKKDRVAGLQRAGLQWAFVGDEKMDHLTISRQKLLAVQLCPWKFVTEIQNERSTTWAVQGLLVLAGTEAVPYLRLPILLTADMPGAARLMQQLAAVLHVP
jgi:hypothetical protein